MTDTLVPSDPAVRPHGIAAGVAGLIVVALGVVGAASPAAVGPAWFATVVPAALLFVVGILGLRRLATAAGATPSVTGALAVAAAAMTLFALAHAYALVDEDTAVLLFSVFMVVAAVSLIVAAVGMFRGAAALPRWATLLAGAWPLATIPAAGALGDVPRSVAIAGWGVTWVVLGVALIRAARR